MCHLLLPAVSAGLDLPRPGFRFYVPVRLGPPGMTACTTDNDPTSGRVVLCLDGMATVGLVALHLDSSSFGFQ